MSETKRKDDGWGNSGRWEAQPRQSLLGGEMRWAVNLNNHTDVAYFKDHESAMLEAARRNYEHGSYTFPYGGFGL